MLNGKRRQSIRILRTDSNKNPITPFTFWLLFLIAVLLPMPAWADTYYLDSAVASSGNGKSWATAFKTIANAQAYLNALPDKGAGDSVDVNTGSYEGYSEANISRSDWLTYKAAKGANAAFKYINISNSSQINTYLRFDGLTIKLPAPNPMPPDDGNKHQQQRMIEIAYANYVQIQNCSIIGINKYLSPGTNITSCNNFLFHHNYQTKTVSGIHGFNCNNFTVTNNYICEMSEGSGIRVDGDSTGTIFSYNHVNGCLTHQDDQYFPHNLVGTANYHPGSGFSIKSSNTTIRNNIVHNGFSQGVMWYDTGTGYENMIMENNLFYDTGFFDGITTYTGRNHFYRVKGTPEKPDIIRNNTFISRVVDSETDKYSVLSRYYAAVLTMAFYGTYDGTGFIFYNNIVAGPWGLPSPLDPAVNKYVENNNIFWEQGGNIGSKNKLGDKTFFAVWLASSVLQGYPNYFEQVGAVNTPQYSYTRDGVRPFFVKPGFYTGSAGGFADKGRSNLDYRLADNSLAINFGDPNNQPADSLGSLDANSFIQNNGPARDKNHHSAGCYEYGPVDWLFDSIGNKTVNENQNLTFTVTTREPDIAVSAEPLPTGANFIDKAFTWTPTYQQAGSYDVSFIATDGLIEDIETIVITVNNVNRPPIIAPIGNKSINENAALTFTASATDPDGDSITYSAQNLPSGAAFASQTFNWTPNYSQAGTYQVTFAASDSQLEDTETITITVNNVVTNSPPILAPIGNKSVDENINLTFAISATDPDGDSITYYIQNAPLGATFANRTFSWTPTYQQAGVYQVTFIASDGYAQDSETITITVKDIQPETTILSANFDGSTDGFAYADDTFLGTIQPAYAKGDRITTGGYTGGALRVTLGGVDSRTIRYMSGGWKKTVSINSSSTLKLSFRYKLTQSPEYESEEYSQVNVTVNGCTVCSGSSNYIARIYGNGNGGSEITTGWQLYEVTGSLSAGNHTLIIGGYNNKKTYSNEWSTILIDDVVVKLQ